MISTGRWDEAEYLMISGIQHFIFCRRQWALIHIEQAWAENYFTAHGQLLHERVDDYLNTEKRGDVISVRGMDIASYRLGMSGRCDLVEFHKSDQGVFIPRLKGKYIPIPIEYKRGKAKMDDSDRYQLLAQIISLEDMLNIQLSEVKIFYHEVRKRISYCFNEKDKDSLIQISDEMHGYYQKGYTPKAKYQKKCKACSLVDICLPKTEAVESASAYLNRKVKECESY